MFKITLRGLRPLPPGETTKEGTNLGDSVPQTPSGVCPGKSLFKTTSPGEGITSPGI